MNPVSCPSCGLNDHWSSVETITGLAGMVWDEEENAYQYDGDTDVDWNSQEPTGRYECRNCGNTAPPKTVAALKKRGA